MAPWVPFTASLIRPEVVVDPSDLPYWGQPTWRDEFDYVDPVTGLHTIDPAKWNVRSRSDLGLTIDAAIPNPANVTVDSTGIAHLQGTWLDEPEERSTSASGVTQLTHNTGYMDHRVLATGNVSYAQQYGRWEIRCKVPTGPQTLGALAAFWLRNGNTGEVDIMEAWGYNTLPNGLGQYPGGSTTTVHTNTNGTGTKTFWRIQEELGTHTANSLPAQGPVYDDFHTWALEWTPEYFRGFFDGAQYCDATPSTHPDFWNATYFGSPNHVRLNLHVGPDPTYWGLPDFNNQSWTQDPLDFQVDYVRIWALPSTNTYGSGEYGSGTYGG